MYVEVGWLVAVGIVALVGGMFLGRREEYRRANPEMRTGALNDATDEWKQTRDRVIAGGIANFGWDGYSDEEKTRTIANILRERTYALLLSDVVVLPASVQAIVEETARWTRKAELIEHAAAAKSGASGVK
jgi:hypothetical protein